MRCQTDVSKERTTSRACSVKVHAVLRLEHAIKQWLETRVPVQVKNERALVLPDRPDGRTGTYSTRGKREQTTALGV